MEKPKLDLGIINFKKDRKGMNNEDYKTTKKQANDVITRAAQ